MSTHHAIHVVTISQQCGSDGYKLAAALASRLQWSFLDQEIGEQVARLLDMTEEEAALYDEHTFSFTGRMLVSMRYGTPQMLEAWSNQYTLPIFSRKQERVYREALQYVIEKIAHAGNAVILDHGTQVILAGRPDVLHIRVTAPLAQRINRIAQSKQLESRYARAYIQHKDRQQERYLRSQHHHVINDPLLYDLMVNNATLDIESQVELICLALARKRQYLHLFAS